jgi:hypothetical protein
MKPDSFRWLPLVVSGLAFGTSFFAWWENHRNRIINEEINRPVLVASTPVIEELNTGVPIRQIKVTVKLKNIGKSTAQVEDLGVLPAVGSPDFKCKMESHFDWDNSPEDLEILAGAEDSFERVIALAPECGQAANLYVRVMTTIYYSDTVNGRLFRQVFTGPVSEVLKTKKP